MNEKWFALSLSEIEKKLKTNAATGLSRKAARSRASLRHGTVFSLPVVSPLSYLFEMMADFAYIMLMVMCVLAICFGESETGIVLTFAVVVNLLAAYVIYYKSQFFSDELERVFLPRCRVIRDGKLFRVGASNVVKGDVIMLEAGDIVPADARLITSENFRVKMLFERVEFSNHAENRADLQEQKYLSAIELINENKYVEALSILETIADYKDSAEKIAEPASSAQKPSSHA